jgi:DNA-directed RNA polymerase I subunit RPA12
MFCKSCETVLPLSSEGKSLCLRCGDENRLLPGKGHSAVRVYSREAPPEAGERRGAKIRQQCPECLSKDMYYNTAQLRSADEGQTIFYECDCGYRSKMHT